MHVHKPIFIYYFPSFIMHTSLPSLCPLLPREGQRSRAEGREERGGVCVCECVREREGEREWGGVSKGGGGVRQYHSSNIFHPLRPRSEPLLVGIVWILSRIWHSLGERQDGGLSARWLPILWFLTRARVAYLASLFIPIYLRRMDE